VSQVGFIAGIYTHAFQLHSISYAELQASYYADDKLTIQWLHDKAPINVARRITRGRNVGRKQCIRR
jgi:hypothetical protein